MVLGATIPAAPEPGPSVPPEERAPTVANATDVSQLRFCPNGKCRHAPLPPYEEHPYELCYMCLAKSRGSQRRRGEPEVPFISKASNAQRAPPVEMVAVSACHFCTTRVLVPPGQPLDTPLLCKTCFERAIARERRESPSAHHPPHPIQRPQLHFYQSPPPHHVPPRYNPPHLTFPYPTYVPPPPRTIPPQTTHKLVHIMPSPQIISPPVALPVPMRPTPIVPPQAATVSPPVPSAASPKLPAKESADVEDDEYYDFNLVYPDSSDDEAMSGGQAAAADGPTTALADAHEKLLKGAPPTIGDSSAVPKDGWVSDLSDLTDLSDSDGVESEDSSDEEPLAMALKRPSGLKIRIRIPPGFSFDKLPAAASSEARPCGVSRCPRMVEPGSRWKLCDTCRLKYRKYQRKRLGVMNPRTDAEHPSWEAQAAESIHHAALDLGESRECSSTWCHNRIPLEDVYQWKRCVKCRARGRWAVKRRRVIGLHYETGDAHVGIAQHILQEYQRQRRRRQKLGLDLDLDPANTQNTGVFDLPSSSSHLEFAAKHEQADTAIPAETYPVYQDLSECLNTLRVYVEDFIRAQAFYIRAMLDRGSLEKASAALGFAFDGEFSIVGGWDITSDHTARIVLDVWKGVESRLGLNFSHPVQPWVEDNSLITRMTCQHEFSLHVPPSDAIQPSPEHLGLRSRSKRLDSEGEPYANPVTKQHTQPAAEAIDLSTRPSGQLQDDEDVDMASCTVEGSHLSDPVIAASRPRHTPSLPSATSPDTADHRVPASTETSSSSSLPESHSPALRSGATLSPKAPVIGSNALHDPTSPPLLPEGAILTRTIGGEAEIHVSEDSRHKTLPGRRIAVRFRLVF